MNPGRGEPFRELRGTDRIRQTMKCQYCEKPATFHITDLTGDSGPQIMHLCEQHARTHLKSDNSTSAAASVSGALAKSLNLETAKEELAELDQRECPVCGITFYEFRKTGRLGCSYDYEFFQSDLQPLLTNIHDATKHVGKRPDRASALADSQANLIELRREMDDAIGKEDYERAGQVRDRLKQLEIELGKVAAKQTEGELIADPDEVQQALKDEQIDRGDDDSDDSNNDDDLAGAGS